MTNHIDTCTAILSQAMRITAQGKWHVFCEYAGHVDVLTVRWEPCTTNYQDLKRDHFAWRDVSVGSKFADVQLAAIRAELDKLEGGE